MQNDECIMKSVDCKRGSAVRTDPFTSPCVKCRIAGTAPHRQVFVDNSSFAAAFTSSLFRSQLLSFSTQVLREVHQFVQAACLKDRVRQNRVLYLARRRGGAPIISREGKIATRRACEMKWGRTLRPRHIPIRSNLSSQLSMVSKPRGDFHSPTAEAVILRMFQD